MSAGFQTLTSSLSYAAAARLLVLLGGVLNGFAVRMIEASASGGFTGSLLGLTLFEIATVAIAASLIASRIGVTTNDAAGRPGWVEVAAALALLVPSSAASWVVVALYAGWLAMRLDGERRAGALLFLALALSAIWSSIAMKVVALPVTTLDATLVGWLLAFFKSGVVQSANVVGVPSEHTLIVMSACSSADGLPRVLVGLAAVLVLAGADLRTRLLPAAAALAAIYVAANLTRLTIMATSWDLYAFGHGPFGAGLFDVVTTLALFAVAMRQQQQ